MHKKRIFSGVQPTGNLHLGNYLGAIKNFVDLQNKFECIYCVVDLHAITNRQNPGELKVNILETIASFIASGLDAKKNIIFNQASVAAHSELAWIFNCVARIGWMNRMTQFKEKAGLNKENASVGLLVYPNLMAADILIYKATHVPVGEDQKQHLELTRDIAKKFNNDFNCENFFPVVEPLIPKKISRVMNLRDGKKKMSKSDESDYSRINLKDDKDLIDQKIKKAKTDTVPIPSTVNELKNRYEASNLISIYASINSIDIDQVLNEFGGKNFSTFKNKLSESIIERICPIGKEVKKLLKEQGYLNDILAKGAKKANLIAKDNLKEIYEIVGLKKFT
jgi:tryptophanyl-tRNA synthetase